MYPGTVLVAVSDTCTAVPVLTTSTIRYNCSKLCMINLNLVLNLVVLPGYRIVSKDSLGLATKLI